VSADVSTRLAFIRGINVGGKAQVPMGALRDALTERGLGNVRTYIQSGNVVYEPPKRAGNSAATLRTEAQVITDAIEAMRGFAPVVIVRTAEDVAAALDASPYGEEDPSKAFIVFLDEDAGGLGDFEDLATSGEQWQAGKGVIHLFCPNGLGRSKLAGKLAASTAVPTTTRNLRTVAKLLELAES
jgi:uncharacterized protein (DUF1697 family)